MYYICFTMTTTRKRTTATTKAAVVTVRLDADLHKDMTALRDRDGMPFSVQIRRALEAFLQAKGVRPKSSGKKPTVNVGMARIERLL